MKVFRLCWVLSFLSIAAHSIAQSDSAIVLKPYKNIIRYNLSGALLFGAGRYIVLGYERLVGRNQSFSINVGRAALPKLISINTDSFNVNKDRKRNGVNVSVDYRFYLGKENKFLPPHGLYIGPYYSYNQFTNAVTWQYKNGAARNGINTDTKFTINTVGFELGYQFILWKRLALDMVMVGPGLGFYNYKASFESNVDPATKDQILEGLKQLLTQKFPGMNFVFSNKEISSSGVLRSNALAYRYIIHLGFNF